MSSNAKISPLILQGLLIACTVYLCVQSFAVLIMLANLLKLRVYFLYVTVDGLGGIDDSYIILAGGLPSETVFPFRSAELTLRYIRAHRREVFNFQII